MRSPLPNEIDEMKGSTGSLVLAPMMLIVGVVIWILEYSIALPVLAVLYTINFILGLFFGIDFIDDMNKRAKEEPTPKTRQPKHKG